MPAAATAALSFVGEVAVLFEGFQDGRFPAVQLLKGLELVADGGDLDLVQAAGGLFPVAGDERDGGALFEKAGDGLDLGFPYARGFRDFR